MPTNDRLFYETIARRIIPLAQKIDPKLLKQKINDTIKKFVVRDIAVTDKGMVIDFGVGFYQVVKGKQETVSRNSVENIAYGYLERDIHKRHQNEPELQVEQFWLGYLEGKAPVKRVLGRRGDVLVLETSHGIPFLSAAEEVKLDELQKYLRQAAMIADKLYQAVNNDDLVERLHEERIEFKLDKYAIDLRFDRFLDNVQNSKVREKIKKGRSKITEYLLESKAGITHADFSPRNLMIEDSRIVVVDHENYREGHPLSQIVSLVVYPYHLHNPQVGDFKPILDEWAREYNVDEEGVRYQSLFWSIRQAGAIARKPELRPFCDFFVKEAEKAL
ncbi:MAG: phosphotransferase [Nanoarchaeota archaeon]|nr:phosphotransferase [Nanoarchaeota archaeon]